MLTEFLNQLLITFCGLFLKDFDDISHQESPTLQSYKSLSTLSHSPFRKLTHLKNSCYSSPARRKLNMTSPRRVKRSSNVHTESCNPASGVNFVTFKKTDMAGESFSTLQMRHILDGVQQQMSDKTTTLTKLSDGSMKLGGKRSAPNTDSFKIANIPGTDSGSSQLVSVCDFCVKVQTYARSRWYNLTLYDSTHLRIMHI